MKDATGGGETAAPAPSTDVAPDPVATEAPEAGAQPAAPAEVTGGGGAAVEGGGSTCYQPAPEPVQCGQWIPAPVATGDTPPAQGPPASGNGDTPPDPIAAPAGDAGTTTPTGPAGPAPTAPTTPASQLPTWPEWQQHFTKLGLSPEETAQIGAANLSDAQLAKVYEDVHTGIVNAGGVPGETKPATVPGASTWSPVWEQKFAALGLPAEFIAELKAQATKNGSNDAQLQSVYDQLVAGSKGGNIPGASAWSPAWEQKFAALGLPAEFIAELKAQAARHGSNDTQLQGVYDQLVQQVGPAGSKPGTQGVPGTPGAQPQPEEGPGWNPQVEQAFRSLGMPDEVVKLYAESGAPLSGLEAAYKHAAGRAEDFTKRGWMQKFTDAKVPPIQAWTLILGDQPAKDEDIQKVLDAHNKGQRTMFQKGGQLATSLVPGGRLLQYAFGKEFVSGDKIDRSAPMEIGMAALSGLAAFAAIRGARTIGAGWAARSGNYLQLNTVDETLKGLGLPATGTAAMEQTAMGATHTWGFKQKLLSLIPGTALHREVVGLGHAEAAARAFNSGGAAKLMQDPDGALQVASLAQMFDDVKSGAIRIHGGNVAYLGNFKKTAPMVLDVKKGQEIIRVSKNIRIGNGNSQLVALTEVAGAKVGATPSWLRDAPAIAKEVTELAKAERDNLGKMMAGNAAHNLAGSFSRDGFKPMRYIDDLAKVKSPPWYSRLAGETAASWKGEISPSLLEAHAAHRYYGQVFDEGAAAIAALDRSNLPEGMSKLLDDASESMVEARAALDAAKAAGKPDAAAYEAVQRFGQSLQKIDAEDAELVGRLFPTYADESLSLAAQTQAVESIRAAHAAAAAAAAPAADDLAEAVVTAADDAAGLVPNAVDNAAEAAVAAQPRQAMASGGSTIGSNWTPVNTQDSKFTGTVSELLGRAHRAPAAAAPTAPAAAPAAAAPAAAARPTVPLTVNARGEAVTGSGLIVPSYAAPASGLAPADGMTAGAIARLQSTMNQVRSGVA